MPEAQLLQNYLVVGVLLFGIGLVGVLTRRNMIVIFLSIELMLQAVSLNLVAFARYYNNFSGQVFVIAVITVAACEAAIVMALLLMLYRDSHSLDITFWQTLREEGVPRHVDQGLPEDSTVPHAWPSLPPAGVVPTKLNENLTPTAPVPSPGTSASPLEQTHV